MKHDTTAGEFYTHAERINSIADGLKYLQIKAANEGCRKLRRLIAEARTEALNKSLSVESSKEAA